MKKYIFLFFVLCGIETTYSQEKCVEFQYELDFTVDRKEIKWFLSEQNPELFLIENISFKYQVILNDSLYEISFNGFGADSLQKPGGIDYARTRYKKIPRTKAEVTFVRTDEQKNIDDLVCTKFIGKINKQTFEIYIVLNHQADNSNYVKILLGMVEPLGIKGLIAEINIQQEEGAEFKAFLKLNELKEVKQILYIDYSKIKESISFPKEIQHSEIYDVESK